MFWSKKRDGDWIGIGDLSTIGLTLAFAIVIGFFAGRWIGGKLGNQTVGSIVGFLFGTAAGFIEMFRAVSRWNKRMESQERRDVKDSEESS
jgi:F0F1-type ATP synthase assembly protein I